MRILVTNDDGIEAEGIQVLSACLSKISEVFVVAPERERSAAGHGITMHKPLRVSEVKMKYFDKVGLALSGTPADCVKLAVEELMDGPPDIIVSGINRGPNVGMDILYSGTVSAAIEGTISGYKSMAVSLDTGNISPCYDDAALFAAKLTKIFYNNQIPENTLLNVNIPDVDWKEIKGVQMTRLGNRKYVDFVERRQDPRGRPYFWLSGKIDDNDGPPDSDTMALKGKFISISPVHLNLTNYAVMDQLSGWNITK